MEQSFGMCWSGVQLERHLEKSALEVVAIELFRRGAKMCGVQLNVGRVQGRAG